MSANTPFPGNIIPTSRLNAAAQKIQSLFYPLPLDPSGARAFRTGLRVEF